jgi:hypothetical protein
MDALLLFDLAALGVSGLLTVSGSALVGATLRRPATPRRGAWIARLVAGGALAILALWLVAFLLGFLAQALLAIVAVLTFLATYRSRDKIA